MSKRGPYKKGVVRQWHETAKAGDRTRCRDCKRVLILSPWKVLDDGTQVYHWVDREGLLRCWGAVRSTRNRMNRLGGPEHRPPQRREKN